MLEKDLNAFGLSNEEVRISSNLYNMKITDKLDKGDFLTLDEFKRIYTTVLDAIFFMESLGHSDYRFAEMYEDCYHTIVHMKEALSCIDDYIFCCQNRTGADSGADQVFPSDRSKDLEGD